MRTGYSATGIGLLGLLLMIVLQNACHHGSHRGGLNQHNAKGNKTGNWRYYTSDSLLTSSGKYRNGKSCGTWTDYDFDGKVLIETKFSWLGKRLVRFSLFSTCNDEILFTQKYNRDQYAKVIIPDSVAYRQEYLLGSGCRELDSLSYGDFIYEQFCLGCHDATSTFPKGKTISGIDQEYNFEEFRNFLLLPQADRRGHLGKIDSLSFSNFGFPYHSAIEYDLFFEKDLRQLYDFISAVGK